jgi:potassium uptake TrkH family protein
MDSNRPFFGSRNQARIVNKAIRPILEYILLAVLLIMLIKVIAVIGFEKHLEATFSKMVFYRGFFTLIALIYLLRAFICAGYHSFKFDFFLYLSIGLVLFGTITLNLDRNIALLNSPYFYSLLILGLFAFEFSRFDIKRLTLVLNPAQLFMLSFAFLIITGTALLELPNATVTPISFIDALFTSTSAICVTGLVVVDTATRFTALGKSIILMLIQIGGIGIMTFTSFFGYFFKGGSSSFSERLVLSDLFSVDNVSEIRKTMAKVVFITILAELVGAVFIFLNLDLSGFTSVGERIRFSLFHSVSAFCNAGFSTLSEGLYDDRLRFNFPILYILSFLIILGGIGFPIQLNLYRFLKFKFESLNSIFRTGKRKPAVPMIININSRLVIYTTILLILIGTLFFFIFEQNNTLKDYSMAGKIAHALFGSVTPRTAGFNSVNMNSLSVAAVVLTIFLMWVGASPVSTGGGIKTSTFAIALLNALRIARLKNHIEIHGREIHERSVDRAFAIIILSIVLLGCSSLIMYLLEPETSALKILFECVSAFGTVGLSLGLTPTLSVYSKGLLVLLMFMGRMGILTLLFAFFRKSSTAVYRYPKETILIT